MLKTVQLYGELADKYGKEWQLNVRSPAEAILALSVNNSDFRQFMWDSESRGIGYYIVVGKTYLKSVNEIHNPAGRQNIKIIPVIIGSKSKWAKILLGAALIFAAPWLAPKLGFLGIETAALQGYLAKYGWGMVIGGIAQLLAPTPEKDVNSSAFSGAVNTIKQGVPVPICYGQLIVGGAVISAGITSEDIVSTSSTSSSALVSKSKIKIVDLISEGEIFGLVNEHKSVFLNETPLKDSNNDDNFEEVNITTRVGTETQNYINGFVNETTVATGFDRIDKQF